MGPILLQLFSATMLLKMKIKTFKVIQAQEFYFAEMYRRV